MSCIPSRRFLAPPAGVAGGAQHQHLGCVGAYYAALNFDYAFVGYREPYRWGPRVLIKSAQPAGGEFEPDAIARNARATGAQGKPWFHWRDSFDSSANDPRNIQSRVHVKDSQPGEIAILSQLRRADATACAPKSARFSWAAQCGPNLRISNA